MNVGTVNIKSSIQYQYFMFVTDGTLNITSHSNNKNNIHYPCRQPFDLYFSF